MLMHFNHIFSISSLCRKLVLKPITLLEVDILHILVSQVAYACIVGSIINVDNYVSVV